MNKLMLVLARFMLSSSLMLGQHAMFDVPYPAVLNLKHVADGGVLTQELSGNVQKEVIYLSNGEDIQPAIDRLKNRKGGDIVLGTGTYELTSPLMVGSFINLKGAPELNPSDVVITTSDTTYNDALIKCEEAIHNFSIQNLKIQGNLKDHEQHLDPTYHSEGKASADESIRNHMIGILLTAGGDTYKSTESSNITMDKVEVSNCAMGIHIKGARDVVLTNMNVHHNGMIEAYYHNLYFRRVFKFTIADSEMHHSPTGNGMNVSQSEYVTLINNRCYNNFFRGLRVEGESGYIINNIDINGNTCTGNGLSNGQPGIRIRNVSSGTVSSNTSTGNGSNTNFANYSKVSFTNNSWQ